MTIGSRRVRLEFFSLSPTRVVNHSRFSRTTGVILKGGKQNATATNAATEKRLIITYLY
jgi:hypothetical protein